MSHPDPTREYGENERPEDEVTHYQHKKHHGDMHFAPVDVKHVEGRLGATIKDVKR